MNAYKINHLNLEKNFDEPNKKENLPTQNTKKWDLLSTLSIEFSQLIQNIEETVHTFSSYY